MIYHLNMTQHERDILVELLNDKLEILSEDHDEALDGVTNERSITNIQNAFGILMKFHKDLKDKIVSADGKSSSS